CKLRNPPLLRYRPKSANATAHFLCINHDADLQPSGTSIARGELRTLTFRSAQCPNLAPDAHANVACHALSMALG
ncbi:MAG: hypothetical protein RB191_23475, partial [Terriglobia bacterium]|nr:hypothetical protein [Terriglobia bacterium]